MSFKVFFSAKKLQSCEQISFQLESKSGSGKAELWMKRPFEDGNNVVYYLSMTPCCKAGQVDSHFPPTGPRAGKLVPPFEMYILSTLRVRVNRKFSRLYNAKQFQKWKKRCSAYHNETHNLEGQTLVEFAFQLCSQTQETPQNLPCSLGPHSEGLSHSIY